MNSNALKELFKPYELEFMKVQDMLDAIGISEKDFLRIHYEDECSKSFDESCINTECHHNYLLHHETQMYMELSKEIQDKRLAIKKRDEKARKKYGYI